MYATTKGKRWAKQHSAQLYPEKQAGTIQQAQTNNTSTQTAQELLIQQLLIQLLQQCQAATQPAHEGILQKADDKNGISSTGLEKMLTMCRCLQGDETELPDWLRICKEKGQLEETKDNIITSTLQKNKIFYDVDCLITAPLLKTIKQC
eukprot:982286-Ditylum_brightwellii.AAC.1